jgi:aryl carrier-like protein
MSEASGDSLCAEGQVDVSIGRPIWNTQVYVLDEFLQPVPAGASGELYIAGTGIARGYLNNPAMTSSRFIANPFSLSGSRLYRTGDRARWRLDGQLDYLGRTDQQVKIRGVRVELGEVTAVLRSLPGVADAIVIRRDQQLVGYVLGTPNHQPDHVALRKSLAVILPEVMIPSALVVVEQWPLSAHGKVNRDALPAPEFTPQHTYRDPSNPAEALMCRLFAEVLDLERVGPNDSFFGLGGDSIKSIRLISRARRRGLKLEPKDVFLHQTPRELSVVAVRYAEPLDVVAVDVPLVELSQLELERIEQQYRDRAN